MKRSQEAALAALALLALAGCHKKAAEGSFVDADGKRGSYAVETSSGGTTTTVRTGDGTAVIHAGSGSDEVLPDGFSVYPGAKITSDTVVTNKEGKKSGVVSFESDATPDVLIAFYKKAAEKAGYDIEGEMRSGDTHLIGGKKADGSTFQLTVNRQDSRSQVMLLAGNN